MKKLFIILISVIFICSCNSNSSTQLVNHEGQYTCAPNIFDTLSYLNIRNNLVGYTFCPDDYVLNLNYKDSTLWLFYNACDIHKYDKVAYREYNIIDKINDLPVQKMKIRAYYYVNTEKIIIITSSYIENLNNTNLDTDEQAWYNEIDENINDYENKILNYLY